MKTKTCMVTRFCENTKQSSFFEKKKKNISEMMAVPESDYMQAFLSISVGVVPYLGSQIHASINVVKANGNAKN